MPASATLAPASEAAARPKARFAEVMNYYGGKMVPIPAHNHRPILSPGSGELLSYISDSSAAEVDACAKAAQAAFLKWSIVPVKDRVQVLYKLKAILERDILILAEAINLENGKTIPEARAEIDKAIECIEFATGLPTLLAGPQLEVSRGVECRVVRQPVGVVAAITPFNFPLMVPMWMIPMALGCGNSVILKPSDQTPISPQLLIPRLEEAGLPAGVFSVINGGKDVVNAILDHPLVRAIGFVGSTPVAKMVYERAGGQGKKVRSLGGAKNHLIMVPDADPEMTATNVVASFTGCAGQRCMAASVLLAVGEVDHIVDLIKQKAAEVVPGKNLGAIINPKAKERIAGYIEGAQKQGLTILADGRNVTVPGKEMGNYLGPTIIDNAKPSDACACDEIFGPTLTIIRCKTLDEALAIENANPFGNAAAIYTQSGHTAQYFVERANAGMVGVNIGVPVPREPFAFGGWNDSKFGAGDITGTSAIELWTNDKKVTTKWSDKYRVNWMS